MKQFKTKDGINYSTDEHGIIHQLDPEIINYNTEYIDVYRTPEYKSKSDQLMGIRLGSVMSLFGILFGKHPINLLDVGYGDGSFLNVAKQAIPNCFGLDITDEDPPDGCRRVIDYRYSMDVVTFWDAFEHIPDLNFIKDIPAHCIFMSLPDAGYLKREDFEDWKHRKPNEHLHHFGIHSLKSLMESCGWELITFNHQEDAIRKPEGKNPNILTAVFVKIKS